MWSCVLWTTPVNAGCCERSLDGINVLIDKLAMCRRASRSSMSSKPKLLALSPPQIANQ
jgi:hypothetical protein